MIKTVEQLVRRNLVIYLCINRCKKSSNKIYKTTGYTMLGLLQTCKFLHVLVNNNLNKTVLLDSNTIQIKSWIKHGFILLGVD